jgi:hypothetical protein
VTYLSCLLSFKHEARSINKVKCFTHPQTDAVAQCSQCQKGVCTDCAHNLEDATERATLCTACFEKVLRQEVASANGRTVGVWVFTGIVTAITAFAALGSISQRGAGAILFIPLAFAASWCLFWGWSPVWNGFRRTFAGWGCFGTWMFLLIIAAVISECLIAIAILLGAFTGIQKYNEARRIAANGKQMLAELAGAPVQPMPGEATAATSLTFISKAALDEGLARNRLLVPRYFPDGKG